MIGKTFKDHDQGQLFDVGGALFEGRGGLFGGSSFFFLSNFCRDQYQYQYQDFFRANLSLSSRLVFNFFANASKIKVTLF